MNLYRITRASHFRENQGEYRGFVIAANTEEAARDIAAKSAGTTGEAFSVVHWTLMATCILIGTAARSISGVILSDTIKP